jgi:hypothetical protein
VYSCYSDKLNSEEKSEYQFQAVKQRETFVRYREEKIKKDTDLKLMQEQASRAHDSTTTTTLAVSLYLYSYFSILYDG